MMQVLLEEFTMPRENNIEFDEKSWKQQLNVEYKMILPKLQQFNDAVHLSTRRKTIVFLSK